MLGWSHKDVEKAFFNCAIKSDLYTGPGGGDLFDRATEKRVARFEREGQSIPDWAYWMPLVVQHAQVPISDRWAWERDNIPANSEIRQEREEDEYNARVYHLDDAEIALIERFRDLPDDERGVLEFISQPKMLGWLTNAIKRAADQDTTLLDLVEAALDGSKA